MNSVGDQIMDAFRGKPQTIYEWPDGWKCRVFPEDWALGANPEPSSSLVEFSFVPPGKEIPFLEKDTEGTGPRIEIVLNGKKELRAMRTLSDFLMTNRAISSKILGFLLDMNAPTVESFGRKVFFRGMFVPWFIEDDTLEGLIRELARAKIPENDEDPGSTEFKVDGLHFASRRFFGYLRISIGEITIRRDVEIGQSHYVVVRDALRAWGLLPKSEQEEWIKENVEMGSPVGITREEMLLFEAMGERLPIWDVETAPAYLLEIASREA